MSNLIPIKLAEQAMAVRDEEIASLKAEVERLKGIILAQSSDFVRSKTADDGIKPEGWNSAVAKAVDLLAEKDKEIARLRKAGDEMANRLTDPDRGKSYFYPVLHDALCAWTAAKEGKPSV